MQLTVIGGNLATKSPFRLDSLTGLWRLNIRFQDPGIHAPHPTPAHHRRWAPSLHTRRRAR